MNRQGIVNAFEREGLNILDKKQIEELERWFLLDFDTLPKREGYISSRNIIIICGCGRSGTTLTRVILDTHPEIYSGPESFVFLPKPLDIEDLARKFEINISVLNCLVESSPSRAGVIDNIISMILNQSGKKIWADKTARNIHCLRYILCNYPQAKVLHVIRDPRDVVASLRTHKKHKIENEVIKPTGYIMPISLCTARWNQAMKDALPFRSLPNYKEIRYEDLVFNPEETVKGISTFCGVDYQDVMLRFHEVTGPTRDYIKFPQNVEATKPLSLNSIGRHKTIFSLDQIRMVEEQTAYYSKIYGYAT